MSILGIIRHMHMAQRQRSTSGTGHALIQPRAALGMPRQFNFSFAGILSNNYVTTMSFSSTSVSCLVLCPYAPLAVQYQCVN
jgi:hypothetical protein